MRRIKIKRLRLENFKGQEQYELKIEGKNAQIRGRNGTGKTTLFDAYTWAMTGKLSDGSAAEDSIKSYGAKGKAELDGGLIHAAEVELEEGNGSVTIRREYVEKYTRGQFSGHAISLFVNGEPKRKQEYEEFMSRVVPLEVFNILTMPKRFLSGVWRERREELMKLVGEVSEEEIVERAPEVKELAKQLKGGSVEGFIKKSKSEMKRSEAEEAAIAARLDELSKQVRQETRDRGAIQKEIEEQRTEKSRLDGEMEQLMGTKSINPQKELEEVRVRMKQTKRNIEETEETIEKFEEKISAKREEFRRTKEAQGVCPTCGAEWDGSKINRLRELKSEGDELKEIVIQFKRANERNREGLEKLKMRSEELARQAQERPEDQGERLEQIRRKREQVLEAIVEKRNELNEAERQEATRRRIAELKARKVELTERMRELSEYLKMAKQYTRAQVELTEGKINSQFEYVRWKLFDSYQTTGEVYECCEALIEGVSYNEGLNRGAKLKAGLDVVETLSRFYGVELPIFIDDAESYTSNSLIEVPNQTIRLVAAEGVEKLEVSA